MEIINKVNSNISIIFNCNLHN